MTKTPESKIALTAPAASLADPKTCGEDLAGNLKRMMALAPQYCGGCADYHIVNSAVRLADTSPWRRGARAALASALRPIFAEFAAAHDQRIDVLIAGCADTAVLSTCAQLAWHQGQSFIDRSYFAVFDRCRAPLTLCEEYAARYPVNVRTERVNLLTTSRSFSAKLVIIHNLLGFIELDRQIDLLKTLAGWLGDDGRLVMWQPVMPDDDRQRHVRVRMERATQIKAMVDDGRMAIGEPKEQFFARFDKYVEYNRPGLPRVIDTDTLQALVRSAGLKVHSMDVKPHNCPLRTKRYVIIVAG